MRMFSGGEGAHLSSLPPQWRHHLDVKEKESRLPGEGVGVVSGSAIFTSGAEIQKEADVINIQAIADSGTDSPGYLLKH